MKFILTRTIVFYLLCLLLIWRILDPHQLMGNAVPQTMSRLTPPIDYFAEFVDKEDRYDRFKLMACIYYHKAVTDFFVFQKAEAYGMLGFCYERLGQMRQSIAAYQQSIAVNPDYFWPYYDLGVIYYQQGQYKQAQDYLYQAIQQSPMKTLFLLSRSKVYNDVLVSKQKGAPYSYVQGLKEGRTEAYLLLMDSLFKTNDYEGLLKTAMNGLNEGLDTQGIFYYYAGVAAYREKYLQQSFYLLKTAFQIQPKLQSQGADFIEEYLKAQVRFF